MKFSIIFENEQILIVDKPTGLVVNRSQTIHEETLQDQLAAYFHLKPGDLGIGDRAGIVHRLDRETSGILVVAKTQKAFDALQAQFKERSVKKEYTALVHGLIKDKHGAIETKLGRIGKFGKFGVVDEGRESRTDFKVVNRYQLEESRFNVLIHQYKLTKSRINYLKHYAKEYTLLHLYPKTGRTHQVRVHLKSIGHGVVSDLIYCPKKLLKFDFLWCPRLFLHAGKIEFKMPTADDSKTERSVVFEALLPYDLVKVCDYLRLLPDD